MTRLLFIFALFLLSAFSCSKDDDLVGPNERPAPVSAVNGPKVGSVDEKLIFVITFTVNNGCGRFKKLQEDKSDNTHTIRIYPKYEDGVCHQALVDLTTSYTFTPAEKGTYTFRFWQDTDKYLVRTVEVK